MGSSLLALLGAAALAGCAADAPDRPGRAAAAVVAGDAPLLGFANVAGRYRFDPTRNLLNEGASRAAALGLRTQFIYLTGTADHYPDGSAPGEAWTGAGAEPRDRVALPLYDAYLRRPELELVTMTAYASGTDWFQRDRSDAEFEALLASERRQMRELTAELRTRFAGTAKTFVVKNWEGDWHLLEAGIGGAARRCANAHLAGDTPDPASDADVACALQMVRWFRARQEGVAQGRADTPTSDVRVYHAVEVNRVQDALAGRLRLVNLLPYIGPDVLAYSSYDAMHTGAGEADARAAYDAAIALLLDAERQRARTQQSDVASAFAALPVYAADPMGLGSRRIVLSELGSPESERARADVEGRLRAALDAAHAHGLGAAYVWQLYDNECAVAVDSPVPEARVLDTCRGFSLYRPDGGASWTLGALLAYGAPSSPSTSPAVLVAGATGNNLVWAAPRGRATDYVVTVARPDGTTFEVTTPNTWYTLDPAWPAGEYAWTVRARGTGFTRAARGGRFALVGDAATPAQAAPTGPWAQVTSAYTNVVWNAAPGATDYVVAITRPDGTTSEVTTPNTWYTLDAATPVGEYAWTVQARGAALSPVVAGPGFHVGNHAAFVAQSVPTTMTAGATYTVAVTMRNTGRTTWRSVDNVRLGSHNPADNLTWGTGRVRLAPTAPVAPGATATFTFDVTAPATPGTWHFQWRMLREGVEWFGEASADVAVAVVGP